MALAQFAHIPVFAALADPMRRGILITLAESSPKTATQLSANFPITRQGVLKHLRILQEAGLIAVQRQGREVRFELKTEPLSEVDAFVKAVEAKWDARLLRLKAFVESGKV